MALTWTMETPENHDHRSLRPNPRRAAGGNMTLRSLHIPQVVDCENTTCGNCQHLHLSAQARDFAGCSLFKLQWQLTPQAKAKGQTESINGFDVVRHRQCVEAELPEGK
jgi:hypothetical protein